MAASRARADRTEAEPQRGPEPAPGHAHGAASEHQHRHAPMHEPARGHEPARRGRSAVDVYLISPGGAAVAPDGDRGPVDRAVSALGQAGWRARLDRAALRRRQRFAGTDADRLGAFERAAAQAAPIVMITRGGYGTTRLLPQLDFERLAASGKRWVGFSDFTAFQLAMLARAGATTWAGPALLDDFGADAPDALTVEVFGEAMRGELEALAFRCTGPAGLDAQGTLWGGNLAVLCALLGTPWFPRVEGGILFLEDVGEPPYRIERMLVQLLHAGVLDAQQAIVLGGFTRYRTVEHDAGYDLPAVLKWLRAQTATPIVTGLPFGHGGPKLTLPHGAQVGLAIEGRTAWLVLPHGH